MAATAENFEITQEELDALIDQEAREFVGMSGEEFTRRWYAGEFRDEDACPGAMRVAMLLPIAR